MNPDLFERIDSRGLWAIKKLAETVSHQSPAYDLSYYKGYVDAISWVLHQSRNEPVAREALEVKECIEF